MWGRLLVGKTTKSPTWLLRKKNIQGREGHMQEYQKGQEQQGLHKRTEKNFLFPANLNLSINYQQLFPDFHGGFD